MVLKVDMEKFTLLDGVKKECKKLMEEAVTRKFVHTDSSCVTSFCGTVECCLLHRVKKRAGGLLPATNKSDHILTKLAKYCETADSIARLWAATNGNKILTDSSTNEHNETSNQAETRLNGYKGASLNARFLWIRIALLEKALTTIVSSLMNHWSEFYEPDALLADKVHGPTLVWLLDGPCSVDFSKMKTPDFIHSDPSSHELVQRHHICSSPSLSHTLSINIPKRRRLFSVTSLPNRCDTELFTAPLLAREHVESLHQSQESTLLYGKNYVELSPEDFHSPVPGYLSLHKYDDSLLLKWTPNPMLRSKDVLALTEKSEFWGKVITIDLVDVVYIHCHDTGVTGGSIVFVSQDGVQLQPLSFPTSASLYMFLTCLDQGLGPEGQLDPPLLNSGSLFKWPKLRKSRVSNKLRATTNNDNSEETGTQDFVFRVVNKLSNVDKTELKKLLLMNLSPKSKKLDPIMPRANSQPNTLIPKLHTGNGLGQHKNMITSRLALSQACKKMKHQILSRAFNGWVSSYRHLKTVRTHLASLVLPWPGETNIPDNVEDGLTKGIWENMLSDGLREHSVSLKQYSYFGGIEPSIRNEVWPYLLGHYSFDMTDEQKSEFQVESAQKFNEILEECKSLEHILQDKEKELLALNGFANGETFGNMDMDADSSINDTSDIISQDVSTCSNISEPHVEEDLVDNEDNVVRFSVIKSLLETRENLREVVEKASERGASAWNKLLRKEKKNIKKNMFLSSDTLNAMQQKFVPESDSFDIEIHCQTCEAQILESHPNVKDGSIEIVECYACQEERKTNCTYEKDVSPYKVVGSPSTAVYSESFSDSDKSLNADETVNAVLSDSKYSEDVMKEFALNIHRIDKDVLRCDRNHPYFDSQSNLEKLRNVIMCYVWKSLSIGYIQGMCDLCAPLLIVIDNEAIVYACFSKLMEKMTDNFPHGNAMDLHLSNISSLIEILDPELYEILEGHEDRHIFYFCYRWFLLDFKRELQYEDIYLVWETIWAASAWSSDHFNLFVALAIIELYRDIIIDNKMDFTDIIKFFNEMAEQHDAQATLNLARNIVRKLQDMMYPGNPMQPDNAYGT